MAKNSYHVSIVGASGAVGQELLRVLEERHFPIDRMRLFGSSRSAGQHYMFGGKEVVVEELVHGEQFRDTDLVFTSAGAGVSREYVDDITRYGAVMIDNSSAFRMDKDIPLVVPEINASDAMKVLGPECTKRVIANPNCSTILMVLPLAAIHGLSPIRRVHVATYQAASGAGAQAMKELQTQFLQTIQGENVTTKAFAYPLAYNVIPHIDLFQDNDYTKEELKMHYETRKIMQTDVCVSATCVRVPTLRAHSESVWVQTEQTLSVQEVRQAIAAFPGCRIEDNPADKRYPMPLFVSGKDEVYVGRIRQDLTDNHSITFWLSGDQIRKGAALNAVQIAEAILPHLS